MNKSPTKFKFLNFQIMGRSTKKSKPTLNSPSSSIGYPESSTEGKLEMTFERVKKSVKEIEDLAEQAFQIVAEEEQEPSPEIKECSKEEDEFRQELRKLSEEVEESIRQLESLRKSKAIEVIENHRNALKQMISS
jgi:uncharacterized coiled-coil DUF342 family protein